MSEYYEEWLGLVNLFEFLHHENYIETTTFDRAISGLLCIKEKVLEEPLVEKGVEKHPAPWAFDRDKGFEYFILRKDMPGIKAGAVFYWDENDRVRGSIGAGCLKLCWTPTGSCYGDETNNGFCADTFVIHASIRNDKEWFIKYTDEE